MSLKSPYVQEMHRELRAYYRANGTDKPLNERHPPECICGKCHLKRDGYTFNDEVGVVPVLPPVSPLIPGLNILQNQRVGGEIRETYLNRLREMFAGEYINEAEFDARQDAMMIANTKDELDFLVRDLPMLPEKEEELPEEKKKDLSPVIYGVWTVILITQAVQATDLAAHVIFGILAVVLATFFGIALGKK